MDGPRATMLQYYDALNARDLTAYGALLTEDVEISVDEGQLRGRDAAVAYAAAFKAAFPGVTTVVERVVAESEDTVVCELRLVNPAGEAPEPGAQPWQLAGLLCEILRVRDGRVAAVHSYYQPSPADRTSVAQVPSRAEAARIAEEQAALRRVATLVARGVAQDEVLAAVNEEIGRIVGAETTSLMRFEPDDTITLLAAWSADGGAFPIGARHPIDDELRAIRDEVRTSRFGPAELPDAGPFVAEARARGIRSTVGVPITVDGRVWGVGYAATSRAEPLPADAEARIAGFAELVATALANAQARTQLEQLAAEQAALRRVAELVARGAAPDAVLTAVTAEASGLLGRITTLLRFEPGDVAVVVATHGGPAPPGTRIETIPGGLADEVSRTGRAARIDDYAGHPEESLARGFSVGVAVATPVTVEGRIWGMLAATTDGDPLPSGTEQRLGQFADLVAAAVANAESRHQLTASRARVIATADETRRRLQRDVHDGAQQRLVQTVITLKLARDALAANGAGGTAVADLVAESLRHAERATAELRDLVHGILPASLSRGGLRSGVESLVAGLPLPVAVDVSAPRLPAALETTAYFVVAEALTNVVKHAHAGRAAVGAHLEDGWLEIDVSDDGRGGAQTADGSGLTGLFDRVEASEGTLTITSPPGGGTRLCASLPLPAGAP